MVGVARGHQREDTLKPYSQKTSQSNQTRTTALSNSMKLSHAHGATEDGRVVVERSDRMWSTWIVKNVLHLEEYQITEVDTNLVDTFGKFSQKAEKRETSIN